jgi:hypothetical protein
MMNGNYEGHRFGHETTVEQIVRRIAWEFEAEGIAVKEGQFAIASGHALARMAYTELLNKVEK